MYSRLSALPDAAEPVQRAQLVAALSVGTAIIHLRRMRPSFGLDADLDAALDALAQGDSAAGERPRLAELDHRLAAVADARPRTSLAALRARGSILRDLGGACSACRLLRRRSSRDEVLRNRPVRRLCRADLLADGGGVVRHRRLRRVAGRFGLLQHVWHPALFVFAVYMIVLSSIGPGHRALRLPCPMLKPNRSTPGSGDLSPSRRVAAPRSAPAARPRLRVVPVLITLATAALAALLGWAMWHAYMGAPWTRDGTVRAYVVTMAPEVAGRIVELPVATTSSCTRAIC